MADVETHRSISINVAKERLQIRTDLSDADLKEIVDYIDERYESYGRYNLEAGKRLALLALEMAQQLFEAKRRLHQAKVYREQVDQSIKDISSLLEEGIEQPKDWE
ncbi:cell division protein ZapA [Fibrobacter sp. UBA4309]|uniref:cell division protein ZapA n=1 Tax=Fibrobacter sp. UBA4309 TaxID=1946537 RepID=UPI0025C489FC|nr:cell division protein ZapA [Fibrobacter sp. UBA4309]